MGCHKFYTVMKKVFLWANNTTDKEVDGCGWRKGLNSRTEENGNGRADVVKLF